MAKELGSNIKYQLQAVFEAAFDEKSAKQVEKMYEKMSERVADSTREEFVQAFRSLGTAINDAFQKLSIPQIDIGKLIELPNAQMFNKLGEEFGAKFTEGFKGVVSSGDMTDSIRNGLKETLESLKTEKENLNKEYLKIRAKLNSDVSNKSRTDKLTNFDGDKVDPLNIDGDVIEKAKKMYTNLKNIASQLDQIGKQQGLDSKEYIQALYEAQESYIDLYRMKKKLSQLDTTIPKNLKSAYGLYDADEQIKYETSMQEAGKKITIPFAESRAGEFIVARWSNFLKLVNQGENRLSEIENQMAAIDAQIDDIVQKIQMSSMSDDSILSDAKEGLKTLNEIEEAYERIWNKKTKKLRPVGKNIDKAVNIDPEDYGKKLSSLYTEYVNLPDDSFWETEYAALVKFVKAYETFNNSDKKHNGVNDPQITALYERLKPKAANAENMLRNVLNMVNDIPFVGMGGVEAEKFDDNIGITSEEIENANKITEAETKTREATEAKTKVNKENIEVAQKVAEAAEKEKIAQEAVAKAVEEKTKNTIIAEQKQSVGSNAERLLSDLSSVSGSDKEKFAYLNTGVGEISPHIEGGYEGVSKTARQELLNSIGGMWDSTLHTHPELIAAPSEEDIQSFVNSYDIFRKNFILAGQQLAEIDFSKLTQQQAQQLADTYKQNILNTDDDRVDRLTNTPLSELGVESVDIDSTLTKVFEQLKIQFPNLLTDINTYIENLRTAFKQTSITNLSQGELEDNIGDLVGENFQNSNQHIQADIYQTTKDVIDSVTKIPAMYQKELQGLFTQTIGNLGLDSSQIFKLHNVDDFQVQLDITRQQVQAHQENTTAINAETQAQENLNKTKIQQAQIEQSDKNVPDNTEELNSLRTQVEDANQRARIAEQDAENERNMRITTENALGDVIGEKWSEQKRAENAEAEVERLRQELTKVQTTPQADTTENLGNVKISDTQITDENILKEKASLEVLEAQIKTVIQAVNSKTAAFVQEGQQVGQVVGKEVSALIKLNTQVGEVNQTILELLGNTKTVVTTANKSKGISINVKTSDDGIKETSSEQKTEAAKKDDSSNKKSARDLSSLEKQYAQLGKMRAQYEQDGSHEQLAKLQNLAYEIKQKRESLKLTQEEIALMRKSLQLSYDAENRLIEGKAIDAQKKAEQKAEAKTVKEQQKLAEKLWKDQVKAAQASTGINAANSMMKSGQNSVINAIGTIGATDEFVNKAKDLSEQIQVLETLKNQIAEKGTVVDENDQKLLSTQINLVKQLKTEVDGYLAIHNKYSGDNSDEIGKFDDSFNGLSREQQMQGLIDSIKANTEGRAVIKEIDNELGEVHYEVKTGTNEFVSYSAAIDNVENSFKRLPGATKKTEGMLDSIKRKFKEIFSYFSASSVIYRAFAELRKGVQYIREIDSALTELKKVTDETEETYEKFLNTASKMADKVGSTVAEIVSSTADWARLGYSMEEAASLAESTSVLLNVSEFSSIDEATSALTSTLQAFSYTADESINVVDVMNEVGNNFAVSSDGIATALQDSASALMTANNSYEEAVALIAAANRVVQDPNSVGSALRTISLRLRGTSVEELEEAGEDTTGAITSKSKLRGKVKSLSGIDILTDTGAYKSTYEILLEISKVWEDMSDINQAALLEIIAGKNRANTAAAILSNTKDLEEAYASAMNAEGSAYEENEKYLQSIQGRIDKFNNALQTMWNNTLDSEVVKGVVDLGTGLIKVIDMLGLIPSILATILTYKLAISAAKAFHVGDILAYIQCAFLAKNVTELQSVATGMLSLKQALLNSELVKAAIARTELTAAEVAGLTTTQLLTLGLQGLGAGFKNLWVAMGPVGWAILGITAVLTAGIAIFNATTKSTEELVEELGNFKTELNGIQSELDSLNSELETTQSRMAELLAMDNLSFAEQEELNNLQKQNSELERQIYLLEQREKRKQKETEDTFDELMKGEFRPSSVNMGIATGISNSSLLEGSIRQYESSLNSEESAKEALVSAEEALEKAKKDGDEKTIRKAEKEVKNAERALKNAEKQTENSYKYIDTKLTEYTDAADGIDYDLADDETKEYLDYIYDLEDKINIIQGDDKAKEIAIKNVLNKETFEDEAKQINQYVEALKSGDTSAKTSIENIIKNNEKLKNAFQAKGLETTEVVSYFTDLSSTSTFDTIDGKINEINLASEKFEKLVNDTNQLKDLFKDDGTINQIKLSELFVDTSDEMRQDITSILESSYDDIKNGTVKIEDLLTKFSLRTTEQFLRVQNNFISNQNKEWFPGLEDEISGIIDTFDELATAVGSIVDAMDTLEQARKEEEYSGSVSIETLAKLMEYTDDYSKIVSIDETGAIHLAADAQNILIQEKINGIKTNAEAAVQEAKLAYQNALAAESSVKFADVIAGSTIPQLDELAGAIAYAGSILGDLEAAMADGFGGVTFSARNSMAKAETAYNSKISSRQSVRTQATSDAEEALRKAQDNLKIANGLTVDNVQSRYSSSVADGSKKDSSKDDAFQKAMDYWENRIAANQAKYEQIQNEIDLLEKQGKTAGEDYYKEQIKLENERLKLLQGQRAEAQKHLKRFKEGSEEWWEVASILNDIEGEIDGVTASLQDLSDAIAQIKWDVFEKSHTRFDNLKGQLETVRELVAPNGEEDWFDDEGMWTEKGVAVAGAYIQEIEIDENALEDTQKKLTDFAKSYKGNEKYFKDTYGLDSEQEYYDKRQELIEQEQEYTKNINSNKQAVIDMYEAQIDAVEEYTSKLIDSYNEYIDTVKEALDAERDLYEFKKDITKQTKDIAQIERRIASLSGSDNAADIAERRKLEAELAEAKEGLNDSYYAHSKDALQNALEEEANAYEETMNKFIEGLRESLDTALQDMDLFMEGVFNSVITNAPSILEQYQNLGIVLDDAITNPWEKASEAIIKFGGVDGLGIMNSWINEGGIFPTFKTNATNALKSPWEAGKTALGSFKQSVDTEMKNIVKTIESNVSSAKTKLNSLTSAIQDTNKQASSSSNSSNSSSSSKSSYSGSSTNYITGENVKTLQKILNQFFGAKLTVDGSYGPATTNAVKAMKNSLYIDAGYGSGNIPKRTATDGKYDAETKTMLQNYLNKRNVGSWFRENKLSIPGAMYAKGTLGTKRDEFAITDESWIGEEITLAAGKNGQLQYLKKGSAVMPADISANLVEWGKLNPNMMNIANPSAGINLMTNYVSKPELNLSFDALVKAGTITQEALPAVKELVQQELNKFTKQLNYSMKRIGAN